MWRKIPVKDLNEILPIYSVENDAILSKMGDITIGYKVLLPEIFTLSGDEYEALHHAWVKAIRLLPCSTVICKQDWFTEQKYQAKFSAEQSFLSRSSERYFNERPYLHHECYLLLTKKPKGRKITTSIFSSLLRSSIVPVETLDNHFLSEYNSVASQFIQVLSDSGFMKFTRLKDEELVNYINYYLNLGSDSTLRDLSFEDGISVGEKRTCLFTLSDTEHLPSYTGPRITYNKYSTDRTKFSIGFSAPLGQLLSCNHLYSQYVFIDEAQSAIKKLERKKLRLQSLSAYSRENQVARDATDQFLNEAIAGQRLPVKAHFNILSWTNDASLMQGVRNLCTAAIAEIDGIAKIETVGAPQIFWAGIPGNGADLPANDTFITFFNQACCFFNMETNYAESLSPVGLRVGDRLDGRPLHIDISDEPMQKGFTTNRNKIIIGPSGSGKSFFTNHLNRAYHECGSHVVIVDVGHSYRGLCEMVGGYYFTYSESEPISFNPFHIEETSLPDTEKKESIKALLLALWKKDDESFNRSEYVALSSALQLYYEAPVPFRCFNSFYEFLRDQFVAVLQTQQVRDRDFDVANFLYVLRPYYKGGEFDYLLNADKKLDLLEQSFIVFELDNIKDHPILFPIVTLIIMELFISKMRRLKGVRKVILIEEAWKAIARAGMAEYIKYLYKTVRKHFGEAIVVTQEIEDILSSDIIKQSIINNADCKILLDQSKYQNKFSQVQELLGLTDKEATLVLSLNKANDPALKYKEVFISLGGLVSKVYRVEVSPEEYLTYTTEEQEKMKVVAAAAKYASMEKGIRSLLPLIAVLFSLVPVRAQQLDPVSTAVNKVIKAVDLKVQEMQNQTIWLQHAQQMIEHELSKTKLNEISDWENKQKQLYANYYNELREVKSVISNASHVKFVFSRQLQIMNECKRMLLLIKHDPHFAFWERDSLYRLFTSFMTESKNILFQLKQALRAQGLAMKDADRLSLVERCLKKMDTCLSREREINSSVRQAIKERTKAHNEMIFLEKLKGDH
ncbi:MAG: conjugation system ATPase, TraG family [Chitinophagaceae bacterium]|nr:conjugation system ATPase, TraG family [Chitinophagaceae bacterium]